MFYKKGDIQKFGKFTGKHLRWNLFYNKFAGLRPATLLKKRLRYGFFSVNFAKPLRTPFLHNTSRRLLLILQPMNKISTCSEHNPEKFEEVKKFLHFSKKRWLSSFWQHRRFCWRIKISWICQHSVQLFTKFSEINKNSRGYNTNNARKLN